MSVAHSSMFEMNVSPVCLSEQADTSSGLQLLSSFVTAMLDIGGEALVIAAALCLFFRLSSSSSLLKRIEKVSKPPKVVSAPVAASERSDDVKSWIRSVLDKEGVVGQATLSRYEALVRNQHVDLRQCMGDEVARSFYLALVEGAVDLAAACSPPESGSCASARQTTSQLLADMRVFGFPRNQQFYSSILKSHMVGRLFADSLWLHDVMVADSITPDRTMYTYLLSAAVYRGLEQKASSFFKEVLKTGPPPARTHMTILKVYAKEHDWRSAVDLLEGLRRASSSPTALVLNTVLGICVAEGKVELAEALVGQWPDSIDVVSCNVVLKGFAQHVELSKSEQLLKRMTDRGPEPNTITFNTIMDCAVRALAQAHVGERSSARGGVAERDRLAQGDALARRPWQLLEQLSGCGLDADRYTCSTLVKGLHLTGCSAQDINSVVALMRKIGPAGLHSAARGTGAASAEASNTRLLEVIFNKLLDACVSIRDLDRMAEIFQLMRTFEVEVSAVTFSTLIKAFGQAGKLDHCQEVWQNMTDAKVTPTIVTFGCYIDVCIRNADMAAAERIFHSMGEAGVKPNSVIYASMIRGFASASKPAKSLELYRRMQAQGVQLTAVTFNSVLDALFRQLDDPAQLQAVMEDMQAASMPPDVATYSILIKAGCKAGRVDSAMSLFRQSRRQNLAFDEATFTTMLLACSKADRMDLADEVLGEMRSIGTAPTQVTVSVLVKMYGKAKRLDKAMDLAAMMQKEYGMKPNLHVCTCLIQACVRNRQLHKSWEVFGNMMRTGGVAPDAITYGTLIHGCIYHNRFEEAMALVRHAYSLPKRGFLVQSPGLDASLSACPPASAPGAASACPLQQDVLRMLMAALTRKGQLQLLTELEAISANFGNAGAQAPSREGASCSF